MKSKLCCVVQALGGIPGSEPPQNFPSDGMLGCSHETINGAEYYYPFAVTIKYKKSTCHCEVLCVFYHKAMLSQ